MLYCTHGAVNSTVLVGYSICHGGNSTLQIPSSLRVTGTPFPFDGHTCPHLTCSWLISRSKNFLSPLQHYTVPMLECTVQRVCLYARGPSYCEKGTQGTPETRAHAIKREQQWSKGRVQLARENSEDHSRHNEGGETLASLVSSPFGLYEMFLPFPFSTRVRAAWNQTTWSTSNFKSSV